jgi:hypothetical protein
MTYDSQRTEMQNQIHAIKTIYRFRVFVYSLNKDIRNYCFELSRRMLENERNNPDISITERERLQQLLNHWQWGMFENSATSWWSTLSLTHNKCTSLITMMHMWVDDIMAFDQEISETSTLGLR